jgi:hypothetical protein
MADGTAYVVEWGAISLPIGHPSRVTCMEVHDTFSEAAEAAEACEFDARVFPITVPDPANEPEFTPVAGVPAAPAPVGVLPALARAIEASDAGHDPLCMAILRGRACTCGLDESNAGVGAVDSDTNRAHTLMDCAEKKEPPHE